MNVKSLIKIILYPLVIVNRKRKEYLATKNPQQWANYIYKKHFGYDIDWQSPRDLNEKIRWLQFNTDTSKWSDLADKYRVRDYVKEKGLGNILVQLYDKWDNIEEIDFSQLPDSFVLKTNHGTGDVIIVNDKNSANLFEIKKQLKKAYNYKFGVLTAEPHYLDIKTCIIAEEKLEEKNNSISSSLIDYKFYCFYGEAECVLVCYDRTKSHTGKIIYDMSWNQRLDYTNVHDPKNIKSIPCPINFERMKDACRKLGKEFPFVRIDFYEVNGKLYFGEMTFTPAAALSNAESKDFLKYLGDKISIDGAK